MTATVTVYLVIGPKQHFLTRWWVTRAAVITTAAAFLGINNTRVSVYLIICCCVVVIGNTSTYVTQVRIEGNYHVFLRFIDYTIIGWCDFYLPNQPIWIATPSYPRRFEMYR
jgi:hypothetical protein